jgi:hypothetical protein
MSRKPTHLCLDCGAVGYAGGYHDHGDGNAGDTASIDDVLKQLERGGDALDRLGAVDPREVSVTDFEDAIWLGYVVGQHMAGNLMDPEPPDHWPEWLIAAALEAYEKAEGLPPEATS